jgi:hypothetical protein
MTDNYNKSIKSCGNLQNLYLSYARDILEDIASQKTEQQEAIEKARDNLFLLSKLLEYSQWYKWEPELTYYQETRLIKIYLPLHSAGLGHSFSRLDNLVFVQDSLEDLRNLLEFFEEPPKIFNNNSRSQKSPLFYHVYQSAIRSETTIDNIIEEYLRSISKMKEPTKYHYHYLLENLINLAESMDLQIDSECFEIYPAIENVIKALKKIPKEDARKIPNGLMKDIARFKKETNSVYRHFINNNVEPDEVTITRVQIMMLLDKWLLENK